MPETRYLYRYKIGGVVIEIDAPEPIEQKEPYSLFLCDSERADLRFVFQYVTAFPERSGRLVRHGDSVLGYDTGREMLFFYTNPGEVDSVYACRREPHDDSREQTVYFAEENRGKLWARIVFTVIGFEDIAARYGGAIFHASYIDIGGEAVLFTAPCETGKSTQAELWRRFRNAEVINGDKVLLSADDSGSFAHGLPFSGSSKICKNRSLPVKAIVRLGQAPENTIVRLRGMAAYKAIFEGCYQSNWHRTLSGNIASLAERVATSTPVFRLDCVPDETAVAALEEELRKI